MTLTRKAVSGIMLPLMLASMLAIVFDLQAVEAVSDDNENEKSLLIEIP